MAATQFLVNPQDKKNNETRLKGLRIDDNRSNYSWPGADEKPVYGTEYTNVDR